MNETDIERLATYVEAIKHAVEGIEALVSRAAEGRTVDPYTRRKELLEHIYVQGGVEKPELMQAVRDVGTAYQWIGQQVKMGYLEVPRRGEVKYKVTRKAVDELALTPDDSDEEGIAFGAMAEEAFAEDWESPEDAVYDRL